MKTVVRMLLLVMVLGLMSGSAMASDNAIRPTCFNIKAPK